MEQVHLKIYGRVQGVFFRANTQKEAARLGLKGWVKNTFDGGVEAVAVGEKNKLEELVAWCRKGPPYATVDKVDIEWEKVEKIFSGFSINY